MIKLFQTVSSKKKDQWHIIEGEDERRVVPLCRCHGYWIGGYRKDKPDQTRENMSETIFTGDEILCPACVQKAYIEGIIYIEESQWRRTL